MRILVLIISLLISLIVSGQQNYTLRILHSDSSVKDQQEIFKDSLSAFQFLKRKQEEWHARSFLTAGYDSICQEGRSIRAYLYCGDSFRWAYLRRGNVPELVLSKINFHARDYRKAPLQAKQIAKLESSIVRWSENNGLPFASIRLDSFQLRNNEVEAVLRWDKGPQIYFDSLQIEGKIKVKKRFLSRHLRIYKDQLYAQDRIDQIPVLLRELPYLISMRPALVNFRENKATVVVFLKDKKVSTADGIIGFLPNESNNRRLLLTGELNLNLRNLFGTGKTLQLEWKKIKELTQNLDFTYAHPRLLGSPLDMKFTFQMLKQDSTFLSINRRLVGSNRIGNYTKINLITGLKTSRVLSENVLQIQNNKLPFSDYNHYMYGLGLEWNKTDDYFFPHRGWIVQTQGTLGNKIIRKNNGIAESAYANVQLNSQQWNVESSVERYSKLGKRSVILSRIQGGKLFNNQENVFLNDLYRIGGLRSLRGFNENNFFAATYGVATLEYRFYTEETSYLLLFADQGYLDNPINPQRRYDWPLGFGAGLSFSTPAGVFNFVYSLGRSADTDISINLSKIHFGITSRF
ncbi:MAG: BamA/TamA family outer membrane protein [Cytophagaceae bacterium]|jgi:outer membrane protein assembly factor BamA|nr:BamA/TamA family outer membrane protein [Cytophagaceae bacterium]